jgi:lysyl-tRNA synthetase class 2
MTQALSINESSAGQDLFDIRLRKQEQLKALGQDPFLAQWEQQHTSMQVLAAYREDSGVEPTPEAHLPCYAVAGRIVAFRDMGKSAFVKILDRDGTLQLYFKQDVLGSEAYETFKAVDIGDIIGAQGTVFKTKTGEVTLRVQSWCLLAKSLRPLPEKWHGIKDSEQIYRQRYLDLIVNKDSRRRFQMRSLMVRSIREFLWARDFVEVETPCLHSLAGGAAARPFVTHMQALNLPFYLRIAPELYLKRLLVGGFDRVFELGRVFRNEGLSRKHNPEFTMLELYQAYSDYRGMMTLARNLIQHVCQQVLGTLQVTQADGNVIDLSGTWREVPYRDLVCQYTQDPNWFARPKAEKEAYCRAAGIETHEAWEDFELTGQLFSKKIEPTLIQPTFVTHLPRELCPLAKLNAQDSSVLDVFELCINGQEIAPAYSEQNDPLVQRAMFEAQAGEERHNIDEDFLLALEHGMPPAGGMGVGIDRLALLLTGAANIRDTILFPSLKPTHNPAAPVTTSPDIPISS